MEGMEEFKAGQKRTWESGDFGRVAEYNVPSAEEFMARLDLPRGAKFLDLACATGNLAVIAARRGCQASGLDIATNLIAQARDRAKREGLAIDYREGDAEALPYADAQFDFVASMYGVMFAPRPERIVSELLRVTRPGGIVALANWTPEGFIGKMFAVFKRYLPAPPLPIPSPLQWGDESTVVRRFGSGVSRVSMNRRIARLRYPFPPADCVEFFRTYYGPTTMAFKQLPQDRQDSLRRDLVQVQTENNVAASPNETDTPAEYLEVIAVRA